jgi:hypothetical protein
LKIKNISKKFYMFNPCFLNNMEMGSRGKEEKEGKNYPEEEST